MEWVFFAVLFGLVILGIPALIIGGIVYLVLRKEVLSRIEISFRSTLRIYFYIALLVSVGLLGGGLSTLFKVGFGEIIGPEFSYGHVYEDHHSLTEDENIDGDFDQLKTSRRQLGQKVGLAIQTSLVNGLSLTIIGLFLLLIHLFGKRWVEFKKTPSDLLKRLYLLTGLVVFAGVTILALVQGVPETLRYAVLGSNSNENSPGEPLSIAIVILPVWLFYLVATVKNMRYSLDKSD